MTTQEEPIHYRYPETNTIACGASPYVRCTTLRADVTCPDCRTVLQIRDTAELVDPAPALQRVLARCHEDQPGRDIFRMVVAS